MVLILLHVSTVFTWESHFQRVNKYSLMKCNCYIIPFINFKTADSLKIVGHLQILSVLTNIGCHEPFTKNTFRQHQKCYYCCIILATLGSFLWENMVYLIIERLLWHCSVLVNNGVLLYSLNSTAPGHKRPQVIGANVSSHYGVSLNRGAASRSTFHAGQMRRPPTFNGPNASPTTTQDSSSIDRRNNVTSFLNRLSNKFSRR